MCLKEKEVVQIVSRFFMPAYLKSEPCNYHHYFQMRILKKLMTKVCLCILVGSIHLI